ncbi:MAG TPA: LysM domain-containing protein, partial [Anaerolineae bacterium]|nr:LysM domain-containing protein [Anaerolineae bacterium]
MGIGGRTQQDIRRYDYFKVAIGLLLFGSALLSLLLSANRGQMAAASTTTEANTATPAAIRAVVTITPAPTITLFPPTLLIDDPVKILAGDYRTISGKAAAGTALTLKLPNGFVVGETVTTQSGDWRIQVLFETTGEFSLVAESAAEDGETVVSNDLLKVRVETPEIPLESPTLDELNSAEFKKGDTITFTGTGTPFTMLGVMINQTLFDAVQVDIDGRWEYQAQFPEVGKYTLFAQVLDKENADALKSSAVEFMVNLQPTTTAETRPTTEPSGFLTPTMNSSVPSGLFQGGVVEIDGLANPTQALEIVLNHAVVEWLKPDETGAWDYQLAFEQPDTYTFFVRSVDSDGTIIAHSDYVSLRLLPSPEDVTVEAQSADDPCASFFAPGEFLPDNQYRVATCETFSSIAERVGLEIEQLLAANPDLENPSRIEPG